MEYQSHPTTPPTVASQLLGAIIDWRATQEPSGQEEPFRTQLKKRFAQHFGCSVDQVPRDQLNSAVDELSFIVYDRALYGQPTPEERLNSMIKRHVGSVAHDAVGTTHDDVERLLSATELVAFFQPKEEAQA